MASIDEYIARSCKGDRVTGRIVKCDAFGRDVFGDRTYIVTVEMAPDATIVEFGGKCAPQAVRGREPAVGAEVFCVALRERPNGPWHLTAWLE